MIRLTNSNRRTIYINEDEVSNLSSPYYDYQFYTIIHMKNGHTITVQGCITDIAKKLGYE